ncbi:MAG: hypothetical protein ACO31C_01595, partial [Schleiferiaceae bacterium]
MRRIFTGIFIATALEMVSSCYYDNAEQLYGTGGTCDSTATWTVDVQPMVQAQCVSCHQGASASAANRNPPITMMVPKIPSSSA